MANEVTGDPGWGGALRRVWPALIVPFPHIAVLLARKADGLTRLRTVFLSFAFMPVAITIVVWIISTDMEPDPGESALPWALFVVGWALVELALIVFWIRRRPLVSPDRPLPDKSDPGSIGAAYRGLTMLGASLSLSAFLMGFVATFIADRFEMVLVGVPFMVVGLLLTAPTAADLARRQKELRLQGSSVDLVEAVKTASWGRV